MFPGMKTVVVATGVLNSNSMHVMFNVPFKLLLTEKIFNVDISGTASLSDIFITTILEEFIISLWTAVVVDETDISCAGLAIPIKVNLHCKELLGVLHVTITLSPV